MSKTRSVSSEAVTIETINVDDRVVSTVSGKFLSGVTVEPVDVGTVVDVDRQRWYVVVIWDKFPEKTTSVHYMPSQDEAGWRIRRIKEEIK